VLDVGTGTARLPLALFRQPNFQGKVIGIDHSLRMLMIGSAALAASNNRCTFIHADGLRLPFPEESFSAVTCLEMLEFTPSPVRQLRELTRVLQPGGILLTTRRRGFDALFMPGKTHSVENIRHVLTELGLVDIRLEQWQVDYDLIWARKPGTTPANSASNCLEILLCPGCNQPSFEENNASLVCATCGQTVSVENNVIQLI
jgi:SAM-dependent methyltransferase